jgi:hypothetical protein
MILINMLVDGAETDLQLRCHIRAQFTSCGINASTAVLFAGTDQTSHLSTAVNGDLNNTHPSIEVGASEEYRSGGIGMENLLMEYAVSTMILINMLVDGTDQTSHLSTAINGDLNNTHPSIEATGFVVIMFNLAWRTSLWSTRFQP